MREPTQCCFGACTDDRCPQPAIWRSKQSPGLGWCGEHAKDFKLEELECITVREVYETDAAGNRLDKVNREGGAE